jgi:hypothetical protein
MPPLRTPLGSISSNRFKGYKISLYMRGKVTRKALKDYSLRDIIRDLKLDLSTV